MGESLIAIGKVLVAVALGVPAVMYLLQDRLLFYPRPLAEAQRVQIEQRFSGSTESLFRTAEDGTRLHAWHVKAQAGAPLVIYFGGNAEEVSWMLGEATQRTPGVAWLLVDYRGYGASEGRPSESALVSDALAWYDLVVGAYPSVFVFGRSLGSGVAVQLASARPVAGAILVTPFDSLIEVAKHHYPWLPVRWMLKHPFDSVSRASTLSMPLLCLVATNDEVIPSAHARRLYEAWGGRKIWVALEGAGHNNTDNLPAFWQSISAFLAGKL